jgi:hypothetical protein
MEFNFTPGRHHFIDAMKGTMKNCNDAIMDTLSANGIKMLNLKERESGLRTIFTEECTWRSDNMEAADRVFNEEVASIEFNGDKLTVNGEKHYGIIWRDGSVQGIFPEIITPYLYCEILDIISENDFLEGEKY